MKFIFTSLLSFLVLSSYAQEFPVVNSDLKLPDSLTNKTEIRIYRDRGMTNYTSLFRMFKDDKGKWEAEFYEHFGIVDKPSDLKIYKTKINSKNDMEYVYLNLLRSYIFRLPNINDIFWKLGSRGDIKKVKTKFRGKIIEEYDYLRKMGSSYLDSRGFVVMAKARGWGTNEFRFSNIEHHLKENPEVDELIFMKEIMDIIQNEFGIWKD